MMHLLLPISYYRTTRKRAAADGICPWQGHRSIALWRLYLDLYARRAAPADPAAAPSADRAAAETEELLELCGHAVKFNPRYCGVHPPGRPSFPLFQPTLTTFPPPTYTLLPYPLLLSFQSPIYHIRGAVSHCPNTSPSPVRLHPAPSSALTWSYSDFSISSSPSLHHRSYLLWECLVDLHPTLEGKVAASDRGAVAVAVAAADHSYSATGGDGEERGECDRQRRAAEHAAMVVGELQAASPPPAPLT
jgi:hypothetical protein